MASTAALGALAGFTIFLGLPVGRLRLLSRRARVALAMFAVGILTFILVDVLAEGLGIVEDALTSYKAWRGPFGHLVALVRSCWRAGFTAGSAGYRRFQRSLRRPPAAPPMAGGAVAEAFAPEEPQADPSPRRRGGAALQTGLIVAGAIGVHNFAEGLAIGVSATLGRDQPGDDAHHRVRPAQRDGGLRHRRAARQHRAELALAALAGRSAAAPPSSARWWATRRRASRSSCASTRSRAARSCT